MKKKKLNKFKIALAIITIPELIIMFTTSKITLENSINLWRLYIIISVCAICNILYIFTKRKIKR